MQEKKLLKEKMYLRSLITIGVFFCICIVAINLVGPSMAYEKNERTNGVYGINAVHANSTHITFSRQLENGDHVAVIFNLKDKTWKVYKFLGGTSIYPKPTHFEESYLHYLHVSKNKQNQTIWSIFKCAIDGAYCQEVFSQDKLIGNFTEIPGKGSLFTTNIIGKDNKGNDFRGFDLFFRDTSGTIKRLTEFGFYQLGFLNVLKERLILYASAPVPSLLKKHLPNTSLVYNEIENIFSISTDSDFNCTIDKSFFTPLIPTKNKISQPSLNDEIPYIAVLQKRVKKGGAFRYDLAIYDLRSQKLYDLIKAEDFSISHPTLLKDGRVIYLEYVNQSYKIFSYSIANKQSELVATITANEIANADVKTLQISKEL